MFLVARSFTKLYFAYDYVKAGEVIPTNWVLFRLQCSYFLLCPLYCGV